MGLDGPSRHSPVRVYDRVVNSLGRKTCWSNVHFMGSLVPSFSSFGWMYPWVSNQGGSIQSNLWLWRQNGNLSFVRPLPQAKDSVKCEILSKHSVAITAENGIRIHNCITESHNNYDVNLTCL